MHWASEIRAAIEAGCPADLLVLHGNDWRELVYTLGMNPVREVWIGGKRVEEMKTLYRPELLYSNGEFIVNGEVLVSEDGHFLEPPTALDASSIRIIELPGKALLPGFVNVHSHSFQRLIRGKVRIQNH